LAEPLCAILLANLTLRKAINERRMVLWNNYYEELSPLAKQKLIRLPPLDKGGNGHIFYLTVENKKYRDRLIKYLKKLGVEATFHYSPLHLSHYTLSKGSKQVLKNTEFFGERLLRLPIFYQLTDHQQNHVIKGVRNFYTISG
jgi:dTDP-4-amino-4,6-dideoxygalactose transaminase